MSQQQLAELVGVSNVMISKVERCRAGNRHHLPDQALLDKLVDALFTTADERETARAQWQYYAAIDMAQIKFDGFIERMHRNSIDIGLRQRAREPRAAARETYQHAKPGPALAADRRTQYNARNQSGGSHAEDNRHDRH